MPARSRPGLNLLTYPLTRVVRWAYPLRATGWACLAPSSEAEGRLTSAQEIMVLATAEFVALPMPEGCDVPVGALTHATRA